MISDAMSEGGSGMFKSIVSKTVEENTTGVTYTGPGIVENLTTFTGTSNNSFYFTVDGVQIANPDPGYIPT